MKETFISKSGTTVTVHIPDITPERQKERDREIERRMVALYKSIVASGRGDIYKSHDKESLSSL